jgi:hypothetical protein
MKKITLTLLLVLLGISANAQKFKVIKTENSDWGATHFSLDCEKHLPLMANKLFYTINKDVFESKSKPDVYRVTLLLKGGYKPTLNKELTISTLFEDGSVLTSKETLEDGGHFNGVCTLHFSNLEVIKKKGIKEIKINGAVDKPFVVNKKNRMDFIKNLNAVADSE